MSSYGDWVAISDQVDVSTAEYLRREFSHGIIAPSYEEEALRILRQKQGGEFRLLAIDPDYEPPAREIRQVFGVTFEQQRNALVPGYDSVENVVTQKRVLPDTARRDMVVAMIALKYTQSNSVCFATDGQIIGMGAGQQSRIHCTLMAAEKADLWHLRQHPRVLELRFERGVGRPARNNAIDQYLRGVDAAQRDDWEKAFRRVPAPLTTEEKQDWLSDLHEVVLGSDAYIPFRDTIDRARQSGVGYVIQPGGSLRDQDVIDACDTYGMVMAFSGTRLFHH